MKLSNFVFLSVSLYVGSAFADAAKTAACDGLAGSRFESVNAYELGLNAADTVVKGSWRLTFSKEGKVRHRWSDIDSEDDYTCSGPEGELASKAIKQSAYYSKSNGLILWDGKWYKKAPKFILH